MTDDYVHYMAHCTPSYSASVPVGFRNIFHITLRFLLSSYCWQCDLFLYFYGFPDFFSYTVCWWLVICFCLFKRNIVSCHDKVLCKVWNAVSPFFTWYVLWCISEYCWTDIYILLQLAQILSMPVCSFVSDLLLWCPEQVHNFLICVEYCPYVTFSVVSLYDFVYSILDVWQYDFVVSSLLFYYCSFLLSSVLCILFVVYNFFEKILSVQ